ncbi:hypothetical protein PoB_001996800 [Plakobranchus ocellatus]|uniref:Uncharacterized protein n=1 Tax=Plakobranchus ocellatus TaxID=259542 RepID=A0AAV3ZFU2_9GAST|nr:hypothetical protein PoB_001996800 [Plakobranchus ocellatus]
MGPSAKCSSGRMDLWGQGQSAARVERIHGAKRKEQLVLGEFIGPSVKCSSVWKNSWGPVQNAVSRRGNSWDPVRSAVRVGRIHSSILFFITCTTKRKMQLGLAEFMGPNAKCSSGWENSWAQEQLLLG